MQTNPALAQVAFPPITEVKGYLAGQSFSAERPLVDLCQAVPDYPPALELRQQLQQWAALPQTAVYSPDEGLPEVRHSLAAWYARRYGQGPAAAEICLTIGASQAFWLAMLLLCRPGDEVIVALPAYFDHPMGLQALGIRPVFVAAGCGSELDLAALAGHIGPRTRALLLVSPSNPTGAVLAPAQIDALFELARCHDIALVLDETYNAFLPPGQPPHQLFTRPDWGRHFIQLASFGKTFALTGYRAGALVASAELIRQALKLQDSMVVCQPRITQLAVAWGCDALDDWVTANARAMQQRHDLFVQLFDQPGNAFELLASGAFFAWVRHPWPDQTGRAVTRRLALEHQLICLPGEAFGPGLQDCLRLAFGNVAIEAIPAAVERLRAAGAA